MNRSANTKKITGIMLGYSIALLVTALLAGNLGQSFAGLWKIVSSPAQLTMDYFKLGTPGGTFLNAGLVGLACVLVFWVSKFELNGATLMAFFLTIGFSFFGMNIMNIWPCIFGTWLFAKVTKVSFASQVNVAVFSTALSPFVSEAICRYPAFDGVAGAMVLKILLGIALGAIAGFLMGILCQHSPNLHRGYTLYNAAAVAGFIGVLLFAFMYRGTGHEIPTNTDIGESYALLGNLFAVITSLLAVVCGFFMNGKSFRGMGEVLKSTGYKCDFTKNDGVGKTLINIGLFGLFVTGYYNLTGAAMTGPTVGCIVCLLAITPCGAHIFNMFPIMLGYLLASTFGGFTITTQAIIVGLCFAGALVPISGCFGTLSGILAGMVHACMVTTIVTFHGGFCLYNGGFTAGITAILLAPVLEYFFTPSQKLYLFPKLKK
jgi:hypothetical protein